MRYLAPISVVATLLLAACGGGSGAGMGSLTPAANAGAASTAQSAARTAPVTAEQTRVAMEPESQNNVESANAFGDHVKAYATYSDLDDASDVKVPEKPQDGACNKGIETFTPDRAGEPNSQERIHFYDPACTYVARDAVRIWAFPGKGGRENVSRNVTFYSYQQAIVATASDEIFITAADYNSNGTPKAADGYQSQLYGSLNLIDNGKTIDWDRELIVEPAAKDGSSEAECGNSAGFNATPYKKTGSIGGWNGISSGSRTLNSDGSVTWAAVHAGSTFRGPAGSLSIVQGSPDTSCPITPPGEFSLSGGSVVGNYNIPVSVTYDRGFLQNLTVTNATLANGDTLNVVTNGTPPNYSDPNFVTGTILTSGGKSTKVASTFNTDAFGNGTLTVYTSDPNVVLYYTIADWHVIR